MFFILRYNKSVAQLLIRWSLECGFVCIPKSVKEQRIVENGDVFDFKISDEDMQVLVCFILAHIACVCSLSYTMIFVEWNERESDHRLGPSHSSLGAMNI